jgi:hypothetical protein
MGNLRLSGYSSENMPLQGVQKATSVAAPEKTLDLTKIDTQDKQKLQSFLSSKDLSGWQIKVGDQTLDLSTPEALQSFAQELLTKIDKGETGYVSLGENNALDVFFPDSGAETFAPEDLGESKGSFETLDEAEDFVATQEGTEVVVPNEDGTFSVYDMPSQETPQVQDVTTNEGPAPLREAELKFIESNMDAIMKMAEEAGSKDEFMEKFTTLFASKGAAHAFVNNSCLASVPLGIYNSVQGFKDFGPKKEAMEKLDGLVQQFQSLDPADTASREALLTQINTLKDAVGMKSPGGQPLTLQNADAQLANYPQEREAHAGQMLKDRFLTPATTLLYLRELGGSNHLNRNNNALPLISRLETGILNGLERTAARMGPGFEKANKMFGNAYGKLIKDGASSELRLKQAASLVDGVDFSSMSEVRNLYIMSTDVLGSSVLAGLNPDNPLNKFFDRSDIKNAHGAIKGASLLAVGFDKAGKLDTEIQTLQAQLTESQTALQTATGADKTRLEGEVKSLEGQIEKLQHDKMFAYVDAFTGAMSLGSSLANTLGSNTKLDAMFKAMNINTREIGCLKTMLDPNASTRDKLASAIYLTSDLGKTRAQDFIYAMAKRNAFGVEPSKVGEWISKNSDSLMDGVKGLAGKMGIKGEKLTRMTAAVSDVVGGAMDKSGKVFTGALERFSQTEIGKNFLAETPNSGSKIDRLLYGKPLTGEEIMNLKVGAEGVVEKTAKETTEAVVEEVTEKAVKETTETVVEEVTEKAVKETTEAVTENVTEKAGKTLAEMVPDQATAKALAEQLEILERQAPKQSEKVLEALAKLQGESPELFKALVKTENVQDIVQGFNKILEKGKVDDVLKVAKEVAAKGGDDAVEGATKLLKVFKYVDSLPAKAAVQFLGKLAPGIGAAIAFNDAVKMYDTAISGKFTNWDGKEVDLTMAPDLRALAYLGAKVNSVDAVWSAAQIVVAPVSGGTSIAVDVGLAAVEFGIEYMLNKGADAVLNGKPEDAMTVVSPNAKVALRVAAYTAAFATCDIPGILMLQKIYGDASTEIGKLLADQYKTAMGPPQNKEMLGNLDKTIQGMSQDPSIDDNCTREFMKNLKSSGAISDYSKLDALKPLSEQSKLDLFNNVHDTWIDVDSSMDYKLMEGLGKIASSDTKAQMVNNILNDTLVSGKEDRVINAVFANGNEADRAAIVNMAIKKGKLDRLMGIMSQENVDKVLKDFVKPGKESQIDDLVKATSYTKLKSSFEKLGSTDLRRLTEKARTELFQKFIDNGDTALAEQLILGSPSKGLAAPGNSQRSSLTSYAASKVGQLNIDKTDATKIATWSLSFGTQKDIDTTFSKIKSGFYLGRGGDVIKAVMDEASAKGINIKGKLSLSTLESMTGSLNSGWTKAFGNYSENMDYVKRLSEMTQVDGKAVIIKNLMDWWTPAEAEKVIHDILRDTPDPREFTQLIDKIGPARVSSELSDGSLSGSARYQASQRMGKVMAYVVERYDSRYSQTGSSDDAVLQKMMSQWGSMSIMTDDMVQAMVTQLESDGKGSLLRRNLTNDTLNIMIDWSNDAFRDGNAFSLDSETQVVVDKLKAARK